MSRGAAKESCSATRLIFRQTSSPSSAVATFCLRYAAKKRVLPIHSHVLKPVAPRSSQNVRRKETHVIRTQCPISRDRTLADQRFSLRQRPGSGGNRIWGSKG